MEGAEQPLETGLRFAGLILVTAALGFIMAALEASSWDTVAFWSLVFLILSMGSIAVTEVPRLILRDRQRREDIILPLLIADARAQLAPVLDQLWRVDSDMLTAAVRAVNALTPVWKVSAEILQQEIESDPNFRRFATFDWMSFEERVSSYIARWTTTVSQLSEADTTLLRMKNSIDEPQTRIDIWRRSIVPAPLSLEELVRGLAVGSFVHTGHRLAARDFEEAIDRLGRARQLFARAGDQFLANGVAQLYWALSRSSPRAADVRAEALSLDLEKAVSLSRVVLPAPYLASIADRLGTIGANPESLSIILWVDALAVDSFRLKGLIQTLPVAELSDERLTEIFLSASIRRSDPPRILEDLSMLRSGQKTFQSSLDVLLQPFAKYMASQEVYTQLWSPLPWVEFAPNRGR